MYKTVSEPKGIQGTTWTRTEHAPLRRDERQERLRRRLALLGEEPLLIPPTRVLRNELVYVLLG